MNTMNGSAVIGGIRFLTPEQAARESAQKSDQRPGTGDQTRGRGEVAARDMRVRVTEADVLLGWKEIAIEIYGPREGARKTWDAIDHLWHVGLSDRGSGVGGGGGVIKLESVEMPNGRRSTVGQCREFLRRLAEARTAARTRRAVKVRRPAPLIQQGVAAQLTDENHQLGSSAGLSSAPR